MLSPKQQLAFALFAAVAIAVGARSWTRLIRRISVGRKDTEPRFDRPLRRLWYALATTLTQRRTFKKRPVVSFFHALIFYGFVAYLVVNLVDAAEGYLPFKVRSTNVFGATYNASADVLSALVLIGVIALVLRRFVLPSRRDFAFNPRTLLHRDVQRGRIQLDSLIVSAFIVFHVGSRAVGAGAKLAADGPDRFQPFATLLAQAFTPTNARAWEVFGYWGALGSVLCFLAYFPRSKHIHIFLAPVKYAVTRRASSGVLPALTLDLNTDAPQLGASNLEDLAWPRLLDAYACIQCNRCQDVCPASATGKALSPSALEINKRMALNDLARNHSAFQDGAASGRPLLSFALTVDAAWGCTTCGACLDVCPVQDEPMLDIIDVRRQQVMVEGEFPAQLQSAFRGMERASNPWGTNHDRRMDWSEGLDVPTTETKPSPDVLFWVGCAASYDPQSQKTARAFVQLLNHAGVDFAVLGKRECCTGDTARRAGNEYLYRQLADQNVSTLNRLNPKLIVATCPHCMNSVGKEYAQIGGDYKVMHHTQYLDALVADGRLQVDPAEMTVAFHDPCYLGRHNGVYDAPRNLLKIIGNDMVELPRNREGSFCCGAGGAQFWKEEEPGDERISDNRYREVEVTLSGAAAPVLAVGCPFCKSMLQSTPSRAAEGIAIKDVAELMLEAVERRLRRTGALPRTQEVALASPHKTTDSPDSLAVAEVAPPIATDTAVAQPDAVEHTTADVGPAATPRKKWAPKSQPASESTPAPTAPALNDEPAAAATTPRKKWTPKRPPAE